MTSFRRACGYLFVLAALGFTVPGLPGGVVINEIHYHPVERPAFDSAGTPLLDLSKDVHEFVELYNTGPGSVELEGWKLSGGVDFIFPAGTSLSAGGFVVVARDPARLAAIPEYGLTTSEVFGPYNGQLGNDSDVIRLRDAVDTLVDAVNYSSTFPWAISANSLGAEDDWTGLDSYQFQYRGRSLERVSATHPANDPANWLASPLSANPSPGQPNAVSRPLPQPVVISLRAFQNSDGAAIIRSNRPVRIECGFSATNGLSAVTVEYFVDDINQTNETRPTFSMSVVGAPSEGRYDATLPGQLERRIVRYRIRADRGAGLETVSPRSDDPYEWHAYFVSPVRPGNNPVYEVFISTASLNALQTNISQSPRRVVLPDPPGQPRASWNATRPAILVYNGEVFDMQMRHHGSRYNRNSGRNSWKWQFPRYHRFTDGRESVFVTDKGEEHRVGSQFYDAADFPIWRCRYVDVYLNNGGRVQRLQQDEMDDFSYHRWAVEQSQRYPGTDVEGLGGVFKATGVIPFETGVSQGATSIYTNSGEGPYYIGNGALPSAKPGWSLAQRCEWTYGPQIDGWKGGGEVADMLSGLWAARGDSPTSPRLNVAATRAYLEANFDVERTLTYMAIRDWSGPFDNATHNHFLWRRADGRWGMLPWDLDSEFDSPPQTIFWDEQVANQPDTLRGPHWVKDSFYKVFREEYKQRLWFLNNTLLNPTNFPARGWSALQGFATQRLPNVNQQLGLGTFYRPLRPVHVSPLNGSNAIAPAVLQTSPYVHNRTASPAPHASTTWFIRRSNGGYTNPIVRLTSTTNLVSLPIPFADLDFGQTYFWKCFYTDTEGHPSLESAETSFIFGVPPAPGPVGLSEILADNDGGVVNGPTAPDFIELVNTSDQPQALDQFSLSDNPERPGKFIFPAGTLIPAQGFLTVWCDDATNAPGLHTGFRLDNDGQTVALFSFSGGGYGLADSVKFALQIPGRSVGRVDDSWVLTTPTPGSINQAAALGSPASLKVNEWMASSTTGADWFELYNNDNLPVVLTGLFLTDSATDRTNTRIAPLAFIAAHGFRRFFADSDPAQGPRHTNFRLGAGGDSVLIFDAALAPLDALTFGPQAADVSEGRLPDGGDVIVAFPNAASPEAANHLGITEVVINEVIPNLELYNPGPSALNIGAWWVSDSQEALQKFQIPAGTTIAANGYWTVAAGQLPFTFDSVRGGRAVLSRSGGYQLAADFDPYDGYSQGTVRTSVGVDFVRLAGPTFGALNALPQVGPVVISEIQYHPPDLPGDDDDYEYVELTNLGAQPAPLHAPNLPGLPWRLRDAVTFSFPPATVLAANERVLIVPFDPASNVVAHSNFLAAYEIPPGLRLFGPYEGKLNNDGNSVELVEDRAPVTSPGPDYGLTPTLLLERVRYSDRAPWPADADGAGASLQRRVLSSYGNEPTNWMASGISPGAVTRTNRLPTVTIASPAQGTSFNAAVSVSVQVSAQDTDGSVRLVELFVDGNKLAEAFTPPFTFIWSNALLGTHLLTARARDSHLGTAISAPTTVIITNDPPQVTLTSPLPSAAYLLPTNIVLEATAADSDGRVERVEFLDNGVRLGEDTTGPYQFIWTNAGSGTRLLTARAVDNQGVSASSAPVTITTSRVRNIAYVVPVGSVGGQVFAGALGMDFDVQTPIVVTSLGTFDSGADGLAGATTLTVQIYARNGNAGMLLRTLTFNTANPGALIESSRFKPLPAALVLSNGSYSVVGYGHSTENPNGNLCCGPKTWSTDDGGGLISFVGNSRYLNTTPGVFPTTVDAGPVDRYAAGTFEYVPVPSKLTIFNSPSNQFVRLGGIFTNRVVAVGQGPLFYQWFHNGAPISGATNSGYGFSNLTLDSQGQYFVVVSNSLEIATSEVGTLTVLVDPVIVQPPLSQNVVTGGTVTLSVLITNTATLPLGYRWRTNNVNAGGFTEVNQHAIFLTMTNLQWPFTNYALIVSNMARPSGFVSPTATLTFVADIDFDGLPDNWEQSYFGTAAGADPAADADGDGLTNAQEYQAGTDPTDPSSYLKINAAVDQESAAVTFMAEPNKTYTIEFNDALGSAPWQRLRQIPAESENRIETVVDPNYGPHRFYRLRTPAVP